MKSSILLGIFFSLFSILAFAKVYEPQGVFTFSLGKETGPARSFQVIFGSEFFSKGDRLIANYTATLEDGKKIEGQVLCETKDKHAVFRCWRDDNGGEFKILKAKVISGESFKYTLQLTQFLLSGEEELETIEIKSVDDKPLEVPGTNTPK